MDVGLWTRQLTQRRLNCMLKYDKSEVHERVRPTGKQWSAPEAKKLADWQSEEELVDYSEGLPSDEGWSSSLDVCT